MRGLQALPAPAAHEPDMKRIISSAICSPRSSWRKCAAPSIRTCSPAAGIRSANTSPELREREHRVASPRRPRAPACPSATARPARRASPPRPASRRRSARAAGTARRPPSTPASGTAPRRRPPCRRGTSVAVAPPTTKPTGRSGVALGEVAPGHEALAHPAREQPGVEDHEPGHALRVLHRPAQADRPAPVLHHHGRALQSELREQAGDELDVAVVGVPAAVGGLVGAAEAGVVRARSRACPGHQRRQHLAVEVGPGGLAVEAHHRLALALVDVVQAQAVELRVVGLEVVARAGLRSARPACGRRPSAARRQRVARDRRVVGGGRSDHERRGRSRGSRRPSGRDPGAAARRRRRRRCRAGRRRASRATAPTPAREQICGTAATATQPSAR